MEIPVISVGNSKGIRLSKAILEQYNIKDSVEMILERDRIIIQPKSMPRRGWDEFFKQMSIEEEDLLLISDVFEDEDFE